MKLELEESNSDTSDFEYYFKWSKYKLPSGRLNSWYKAVFCKGDGDYVKIGDVIFTLKLVLKSNNEEYSETAKIDGYLDIVIDKKDLNLSDQTEGKLFYKINKNDDKRIERKFINVPLITKDEFSGSKIIKWLLVGGQGEFKSKMINSFSNENGFCFLDFVFNYLDNKDYIVFQTNPKQLVLSKDDSISFLFDNKEIIEFKLVANSYKLPEKKLRSLPRLFDAESVSEYKLVISEQELLVFENNNIIQWKIKLKKENREINGGQRGKVGYITECQLQLSTITKKLAKEYRALVRREIENYQPFLSKSGGEQIIKQTTGECYVYLMIDYTNNFHKIGISNNPEYREQTLLGQKPTIELIASKKYISTKIAATIEKALHTAYADKRVRGEWFQLNAEELFEIKFTLNN